MIDLGDPRTAYLLAVADDDLVIGHRETHWIGVAPSLETDIAFSGISQDEINHADVWYQLLTGGERDAVDELGLGRTADQYRHAQLLEQPPGDFARTLAVQFLYDHADTVRLAALSESSDAEVAAIARKLAHEERYHLEHADTWFWRLARGGDEAARRLRDALASVFGPALEIFEPTPGEDDAVASGLVPNRSRDLLDRWLEIIGPMLDEAGFDGIVEVPAQLFAEPAGRHGVHTAAWTEDAWPEMTDLHRRFKGATW